MSFDADERFIVPVKERENVVVLAVGDTHHPFVDKKKLSAVYDVARDIKPTHIVQIGDLYDMYTFSRFSRSVNLITPKDELLEGKKQAGLMWETFQRIAPKAKCFQLRGNHSHRIVKSLLTKAPEYESLLEGPISSLTSFPGVKDMKSYRSEIDIGGVLFVHGWSMLPGFHSQYFGQSVVCGHTHRGYVTFKAQKGRPLFELNCGHIADVEALPLQYGETRTNSWIAGCGVLDNRGPKFIAL